MTPTFTPAVKKAAHARIALAGPSGSGKTYTALAIAAALSKTVAVIDTVRCSASKYVGINDWSFDVVEPDRFAPLSLVDLLGRASGAMYGAIVVDCLSDYWDGADGMLEQVDQRARSGNPSSGWKEVRPDERLMLDALLSYPGHVIATLRTKVEYVVDEDEKGRKVPRRIGMKPIQRDGIEGEFDLVGDMDTEHRLTVAATRLPEFDGAVILKPGSDLASDLASLLADGAAAPSVAELHARAADLAGFDELVAFYHEVRALHLTAAPILDGERPTTLGQYIRARGDAAKSGNRS